MCLCGTRKLTLSVSNLNIDRQLLGLETCVTNVEKKKYTSIFKKGKKEKTLLSGTDG